MAGAEASGLLEELAELAEKAGLTVRRAAMGGDGGALARVRGQWVMFIDVQAEPAEQIVTLAEQLAPLIDIDTHYLSPALRQLMGAEQ